MAVALVTGSVVGGAFGEGFAILHETVKNVVGQAIMFKSILEDLESTLERIAPVVQEIRQLSLALDRPERETKILTEQMKKGAKLVRKCSKIQCWNYCFKSHYATKLSELNEDIEKFCRVDLIVQSTRTGLETLTKVDLILEKVSNQNSDVKRKYSVRTLSCAVPRPRDFIVGLHIPLMELKEMLLKKEESLLLLTALGGCGKTTLIQMLCWDHEIKGTFLMLNLLATIAISLITCFTVIGWYIIEVIHTLTDRENIVLALLFKKI